MKEEEKLLSLINRSTEFQTEIANIIQSLSPVAEDRFTISYQSGLLAFEHANAALLLINSGLFASGYSHFRPQFESLIRGIWLLYSASDSWINKLNQPLTMDSASKADKSPMLSEMLTQIENSNAPTHLVLQLKEYKDTTWKALNSYSHAGFHPLTRTIIGYPAKLTYDSLRNSNAVSALTVQLLVILSSYPERMSLIRELHKEFLDCLPIKNF